MSRSTSSSANPWIRVSGVRSSWETVEIRADLTSSISRSRDTSRITSTPPTTRALASKMGADETATGTRRP